MVVLISRPLESYLSRSPKRRGSNKIYLRLHSRFATLRDPSAWQDMTMVVWKSGLPKLYPLLHVTVNVSSLLIVEPTVDGSITPLVIGDRTSHCTAKT